MDAVHELIERDRLYAGGERVEPENGRTTDVIYPFIQDRSDARRSPHARVLSAVAVPASMVRDDG